MVVSALPLPSGRKTYLDSSGRPLAGGTVAFYTPGTTTPVITYRDDNQATPNQNPVVLDAAGSCVVFAVGEFREYVRDALGNTISDSVVVAPTPLFISAAMLPVLQSQTVAEAETLLAASVPSSGGGGGGGTPSTTHLQLNPADQSLNIAPIANPPPTLSSFDVTGISTATNKREFLGHIGFTSNTSNGLVLNGINADKVALYLGMDSQPGTADTWALNSVTTQQPLSGNYNCQGYELDFNNLNVDRGNNGNLISDFTAPISQGLTITGAGTKVSTAGLAVESQGVNGLWSRGIVTLGKMPVCAYQEWSTTPVGIQFDGSYSTAVISLVGLHGNAGAVGNTALFLKNSHQITWQTQDLAGVISDGVNSTNDRVVGLGNAVGLVNSVIMGANTVPLTSGVQQLGTAVKQWGDAWLSNVRLPNLHALTWTNAAGNNFVFDMVDSFDTRLFAINAAEVQCGANFIPTVGLAGLLNLGSAATQWSTAFFVTAPTVSSDIRLKTEITALPSMMDLVNRITPISYKWKPDLKRDEKLHFGFSADDIRDVFPENFAGYHEEDDKKFIVKDELIAVLWQAVRELSLRVQALEI